MPTALRSHRAAIVCAVACALLGFSIGAPSAVSANADPPAASALAQERYYSSYGTPQQSAAAVAQERYYSSYGQPEPLTLTQSPAASHDTPWLPIALSLAIVLTLAVASATQLRRLRTRHRGARAAA
jgi:hypothetical protein